MEAIRPNTAGEIPATNEEEIKQALARNFAKKLIAAKNVPKDVKQSITELRNEFMMNLAKVYENDTKKDGVLGCHRIITRYTDNPAALRVVLGALCDRSS